MLRSEGDRALVVLDAEGRVAAWNAAAAALPPLQGALAAGMAAGELERRLGALPWTDTALSGGGCVRLIGAGAAAQRGSRLFAAASHDLRQPLAALSLLVGALDGRVGDPGARDVLKAMDAAVQSMKTMVDGHFDLARLNAGLLDPDVGPHAVNGLLTRLALDFAPRFEARGLHFSVQPCSAMVETDATLLERILHALLANALAQTDRGRVLLGCLRRGDELCIGVWDTGRGLGADRLAAVRDALGGAAEADDDGQTLGLGLALAGGLARRLGHPILVDSLPGRGSLFAVRVRRAAEAEAEPDPTPEAPSGGDVSRARVLVVEDDELVLSALEVLLGQWGCAVIGADSYEAAMERLEADPRPPDLIVSDLRLPGTANGIVVIRQIAKALGVTVPGLILTGDTDPKRLREARLSGYPLLHKPVAPLALRAALANLLGRDRLAP